jgi:hypothetical protein
MKCRRGSFGGRPPLVWVFVVANLKELVWRRKGTHEGDAAWSAISMTMCAKSNEEMHLYARYASDQSRARKMAAALGPRSVRVDGARQRDDRSGLKRRENRAIAIAVVIDTTDRSAVNHLDSPE